MRHAWTVFVRALDGTDMEDSVDGEAWLETFHLPTLHSPQLLLNLKIKQDPGFSFLYFYFLFAKFFTVTLTL